MNILYNALNALCSIVGIHIIVAVSKFQYQFIDLVGEPVQRGLEFWMCHPEVIMLIGKGECVKFLHHNLHHNLPNVP